MSFGFSTFDPYLTFAEGERGYTEKIFVRADGTPTEAHWYGSSRDGKGYLTTIWRLGRNAYSVIAERLERQPTIDDFKEISEEINKLEKDYMPLVQTIINDGKLIVTNESDSSPVSDLSIALKDADASWFTELLMRVCREGVITGELDTNILPDFEALLYACAILHLDDYIIAEQLSSRDLDLNNELIHRNIASAELYKETISVAKGAISAMGRRFARSRHKETNNQKAAAQADWAANGHAFSSRTAFARNNHRKYDVTERTLCEWIADYEKSKS